MKNLLIGKFSSSVGTGTVSLLSILLLASGCAHDPDVRLGGDKVPGVTTQGNAAYIACIKEDIARGAQTFTVEDNGKTQLFIGSQDPKQASGLVEMSGAASASSYTVYQQYAWYDKGRLINAALACDRA
ncbi:hypothetical protein D9M71_52240 [compost metagenome]